MGLAFLDSPRGRANNSPDSPGRSARSGALIEVWCMAWLTKDGRRYYYRSIRVGGRVRSVYVGTGPLALLAAAEDEEARRDRDRRRRAVAARREALAAAERPVAA